MQCISNLKPVKWQETTYHKMKEGRITQHRTTRTTLNIGVEVHTDEMSSYLEPLKAKMVDLVH